MFSNFSFNPFSIGNVESASMPQSAYAQQHSQNYRFVHGQVGDGTMSRRAAGSVYCPDPRQYGGAGQRQALTRPVGNEGYGDANVGAVRPPPSYDSISPHYGYTRAVPSPSNGLLNYRDGRFPSGYGCGYIDAGDLNVEGIGYGAHMPMQ